MLVPAGRLLPVVRGALEPTSDVLPPRPPGRMRVVLNVHGGQQALARVLDGLVDRNVRAIKSGKYPSLEAAGLRTDSDARAWKDIPMAVLEGYVSPGSEAVWYAAELRAQGVPVAMGFRDGKPAVYKLVRGRSPQLLRSWPDAPTVRLPEKEGRTDERMVVAIDDDKALAVREINQAIARHNALRIKQKRLPPLYNSGVVYKPEGSPELWWDAEEILRRGHDDCEGLAAYRAGELIAGIADHRSWPAQVWTRLVKTPSKEMGGSGKGGRLFHAIVRIPDGAGPGKAAYDDPSVRLGMKVPQWYREFAAETRAAGREL